MTDDTDPDDPEDQDDAGKQEQPTIDEDEMADMDSIAEQVEADVGAGSDDLDENADEQDDADDAGQDLTAPGASRTSIGDVYCNVLGMGAAVTKDRYGSGIEGDRKDVLDDYSEIAKDLEIDKAVDDLIEQHGGPDSLSPGQTVLVMTIVFWGMVAMEDPSIIEGLADEGGISP